MNLVILTSKYPFETGEEFLNSELFYLCKEFDHVYLIPATNHTSTLRKMPNNCSVLYMRKSRIDVVLLIKSFISLFSLRTMREVKLACKNDEYSLSLIFKEIIVYHYFYNLLSRLIKKSGLDSKQTIYYAYWLNYWAYASALLKKKGKILHNVSRGHGGDTFSNRGYQCFRNIIYNYTDKIFFISKAGHDDFISAYLGGSDNKKSLDVNRLGVSIYDLKMEKENLDFCILSCSTIVKLKRLDLIIDTISKLDIPNLKWIHIGDGELFKQIFDFAKSKISNCEYEFMGQKSHDFIINFYKAQYVDLFINLSDYEGIPVSIMEAMSFQIPTIARDIGGISEIIEDSFNGYLLPNNLTADIAADSIMKYYRLPESDKLLLRNNALKTIKQKFNAIVNYKDFIKKVKDIV